MKTSIVSHICVLNYSTISVRYRTKSVEHWTCLTSSIAFNIQGARSLLEITHWTHTSTAKTITAIHYGFKTSCTIMFGNLQHERQITTFPIFSPDTSEMVKCFWVYDIFIKKHHCYIFVHSLVSNSVCLT